MSEFHHEADVLRKTNVWSEHKEYPRQDWQYEVANNNTNLGYWEWLSHRLETRDDEKGCA